MSVREVVMVGALFGRDRRERRVATAKLRADEMLSHLGLDGADRPAATLNIVDRKRLALARALAMEPKLLLLDEVMAGLTPPEVEVIASLLAEVHAGGIALIIVEHLMHAIARLCERAVVLHQGRVLAEGPPGAVLREAQVVEAYLGHGRSRMIAERRTGSEHH
jgi:branched-chain amino acid transport system ATP-binding protein